jgi:beta-glucosidase
MLQSTLKLPCVLDKESTMNEWMADPRGKFVLGPIYEQIEKQTHRVFGDQDHHSNGQDHEDGLGMGDIMDMMSDMPLVSVLMFQQNMLTMPPEEIVDSLLRQAHSLNLE